MPELDCAVTLPQMIEAVEDAAISRALDARFYPTRTVMLAKANALRAAAAYLRECLAHETEGRG